MQGVSFVIGAAYRGTLRAVKGARWIVGLRLADIGPNVKASDGERYGLPTRGSLGGSLHLPFRPNHVLGIALDLGHQFRGGITGLSRIHLFPARCRARRIPPRSEEQRNRQLRFVGLRIHCRPRAVRRRMALGQR